MPPVKTQLPASDGDGRVPGALVLVEAERVPVAIVNDDLLAHGGGGTGRGGGDGAVLLRQKTRRKQHHHEKCKEKGYVA